MAGELRAAVGTGRARGGGTRPRRLGLGGVRRGRALARGWGRWSGSSALRSLRWGWGLSP